MSHTVTTHRTSDKTADIDGYYTIEENETTRKILRAQVVDNPNDPTACISCEILHQRKSIKNEWEDVQSINLNTLKAGEGVRLLLGCKQTKNLKLILDQVYEIGKNGVSSHELIVARKNEVIIPKGKESQYVKQLLNLNLEEDIWEQLVDHNPDIATKLSYARIQAERKQTIEHFNYLLQTDQKESTWQNFFSENDWILGYSLSFAFTHLLGEQCYLGGKDTYNHNGKNVDFLLSTEGKSKYIALVEIKTPQASLLDSTPVRNNSFAVSRDLVNAVAQLQAYQYSASTRQDREWTEFEQDNELTTVYPRGILIIGNTGELDSRAKKRSFELYRSSLHNIEIITFDEMYERSLLILGDKTVEASPLVAVSDLPF